VSRHLARCGRCRDLSAGLEAVSAALASVPAPPLPGHLQARIEDALTAEAARRATGAAGAKDAPAARRAAADRTPAVPGRSDLPERGRHARRRGGPADRVTAPGWRAWRPGAPAPAGLRLVAAAGAVIVLAGAGVGIWRAAQPPVLSHAGAAAGSRVPRHAAAPAAGGALTLPYRANGRTAVVTVRSTGQSYQSRSLGRQVRKDLATFGLAYGAPSTHGAPTRPTAVPANGGANLSTADAARLAGCVSRLAAGRRVLLVDLGYYRGQPATVVAIRSPGAGSVTVLVVGTACSATRSDVLAHTTLPG
jgi:hypothetical protein